VGLTINTKSLYISADRTKVDIKTEAESGGEPNWIKGFDTRLLQTMQYNKSNFGQIKLTVGILRGSREKLQYCITAIEKTTIQPATNTQ
jgi:hypothetical protein